MQKVGIHVDVVRWLLLVHQPVRRWSMQKSAAVAVAIAIVMVADDRIQTGRRRLLIVVG